MRKYLNEWETTISTPTVLSTDLTFDVVNAPPSLAAGNYYILRIVDSLDNSTKSEFVKVTDVSGNTLTCAQNPDGTPTNDRGWEGSTAQEWSAGAVVHLVATAGGFEELDGPTLLGYKEGTGVGTTSLNASSKTVQSFSMTANTTFTDELEDGQNLTLHLSGADTWTATWPTSTLVGGSVTPTANDVWVFWKMGTTLFRRYGGSY